MIMDRDRDVIKHLESYKSGTIDQIRAIYFNKQKNGYNITRRRLIEIKNAGYAKVKRDTITNQLVYYLNDSKVKPPDLHRILVLDVLAKLHEFDFDVHEFEVEKYWMGGKVRSDAFTVFSIGDYRFQYFVEVQLSNNGYNLEKYDTLYESQEVQNYLGRNVYPKILLVTDRKPILPKLKYVNKIVVLNLELEGFAKVMLP